MKSQGLNAENSEDALTRPAKTNEIQREFGGSRAEQSLVGQYSGQEKFDECQLSAALCPHNCFIHFFPLLPVFSWMKMTFVEGAIIMKQCYGTPYSIFTGAQWYFLDSFCES